MPRVGKRGTGQAGNFNFEIAGPNCYAAAMSRKSSSDSGNGFGDIIGVALLAAALLLIVAQLSFDRYDISFFKDPHNEPIHNLINVIGAYLAWGSFLPLGLAGYLVPVLLAAFGVAYLLNFLGTCGNISVGRCSGRPCC